MIQDTIAEAAEKFGVAAVDILAGRKCRNAHVLVAREWIIAQFPEMSDNALSKLMGYKNHSSITHARRRLASNNHNSLHPTKS